MTWNPTRSTITAWLGADHGLTNEQITGLVTVAKDIARRYPDTEDTPELEAALETAYKLISDPENEYVLGNLADDLLQARLAEARALAAIQQAAHQLVATGKRSENSFAAAVGVDRMTVRKWLGKRD